MDRAARGDAVKLDTTTVLVLLFVITRCGKRRSGPPSMGGWVPAPDPEGYNVPVVPLPNPPEEG